MISIVFFHIPNSYQIGLNNSAPNRQSYFLAASCRFGPSEPCRLHLGRFSPTRAHRSHSCSDCTGSQNTGFALSGDSPWSPDKQGSLAGARLCHEASNEAAAVPDRSRGCATKLQVFVLFQPQNEGRSLKTAGRVPLGLPLGLGRPGRFTIGR